MPKPHIDRQGEKELNSVDGIHRIQKIDTLQPNSPPSPFSKALPYIPYCGALALIFTLVFAYINYREKVVQWQTDTTNQINSMVEKINSIVALLQQEKTEVKYVCCYIGLMHQRYKPGKKTAWDYLYTDVINKKVCEINESFNFGERIDLPGRDDFIKIINSKNGKCSWAKAVGKFKDLDNPNRALIISKKVKSDLFPGRYKSGISMNIRPVKDPKRINELNELFNNS